MTKTHEAVDLIVKLRLERAGDIIMGPGRADLLANIETAGSIAAAGRAMGMSYKRAWALVEDMNALFTSPLVEAMKGGVGGGGARLTVLGLSVLKAYRDLEALTKDQGCNILAEFHEALAVSQQPKAE